jgi:hypothetical protein
MYASARCRDQPNRWIPVSTTSFVPLLPAGHVAQPDVVVIAADRDELCCQQLPEPANGRAHDGAHGVLGPFPPGVRIDTDARRRYRRQEGIRGDVRRQVTVDLLDQFAYTPGDGEPPVRFGLQEALAERGEVGLRADQPRLIAVGPVDIAQHGPRHRRQHPGQLAGDTRRYRHLAESGVGTSISLAMLVVRSIHAWHPIDARLLRLPRRRSCG